MAVSAGAEMVVVALGYPYWTLYTNETGAPPRLSASPPSFAHSVKSKLLQNFAALRDLGTIVAFSAKSPVRLGKLPIKYPIAWIGNFIGGSSQT